MLTHDTDTMRAEIAQHIAADAVRGGHYWDGQTGCFIGCLAHSSRVEVTFQNTGREMPQTLDFVAEVGRRWGVLIAWLEYRAEAPFFEIVGRQGDWALSTEGVLCQADDGECAG